MEKPEVALLKSSVPVLAFIRALWVAVHAVLETDSCQGAGVGKAGSDVDHPTQRRTAVQHGTRTLDDLNLFQILKRQEAPSGPPGVSTQHGQIVHHHHDTGPGAVAEAAATADLGFSIHHADPRRLFDGGFQTGRGLVLHQGGLEHFQGHRDLRCILLKSSGRNDHKSEGFGSGRHDWIPFHSLASSEVDFEFLFGHADEGAHHGVGAWLELQRVEPIEVGRGGRQSVGQIGSNQGFIVAVKHAALEGLAPRIGGPTPQPEPHQQRGKEKTSHEAK